MAKRIILRLEAVQDDYVQFNRAMRSLPRDERSRRLSRISTRRLQQLAKIGTNGPWVAEITGLKPDGTLERRFVKGLKDYSRANSVGSRGVYLYFVLHDGPLYEIFDRPGYDKSRRRFARIENGKLREVPIEEALKWALGKSRSASTC